MSDIKYMIYQDLTAARDPNRAEEILLSYWRSSFGELQATPHGAPQIGVPGGALLRVTDLVLLGGPMLAILQIFFLIFWSRSVDSSLPDTPFVFPVFGSPPDPLARPLPHTLAGMAERTIWLSFLVVPAIIIVFAVITRYDISVLAEPKWGSPTSWLAHVSLDRRHDTVSCILDVTNLFALLISMVTIVQITTVQRQLGSLSRWLVTAEALLSVAFVVAVGVYVAPWPPELIYGNFSPASPHDLLLWVAFGTVWCLVLPLALRRRSVLVVVMAVGGVALFVAMLLPKE